ncbi:MAG: hypothetical protein HYS44_00320 [Candidatus Niyogibacteria bacterium]|nr:hypothetical protein [Candidatus Niyogibacteria bacterium]
MQKCQNCKTDFRIEPEDFEFYKKMNVPPPTWCPECRMVRRFSLRNERAFYKRTCGSCKKDVVSVFAPDAKRNVYCPLCYKSDKWDPFRYGQEIDFSKPFLEQLRQLWEEVPVPAVFTENCVDSPYTNHTHDSKNSYLVFGASVIEDSAYCARLANTKDSFDVTAGSKMEQCYEDISCNEAQKLFFSVRSENCFNSYFLEDCRNVSDSFGCVNLRNKQYHIFNKPYTKEDYEKTLAQMNIGSRAALAELRRKVEEFSLRFPRRFAHVVNSQSVTGDNIVNSKNCRFCFNVYGNLEDCAFVVNANDLKDGYDGYGYGAGAELLYEGADSGVNAGNMAFTLFVHGSHHVRYCFNCHGSSDLFGCVGLRSQKYCILNRQYTQEQYDELVGKIVQQMNEHPYTDAQGRIFRYGEFFPPDFSTFAYNESAAQEYFPLTADEARRKGFRWRDPAEKTHAITIRPETIPDAIRWVPDSILKETLGCAHRGTCNDQCTNAFRIIPMELAFYRKMNLPLPDLCPNCRHYRRLAHQNPYRLWHRACQCAGTHSSNGIYQNQSTHFHADVPCPNEFETTYAPERPEIVYCEQCYQEEVV